MGIFDVSVITNLYYVVKRINQGSDNFIAERSLQEGLALFFPRKKLSAKRSVDLPKFISACWRLA